MGRWSARFYWQVWVFGSYGLTRRTALKLPVPICSERIASRMGPSGDHQMGNCSRGVEGLGGWGETGQMQSHPELSGLCTRSGLLYYMLLNINISELCMGPHAVWGLVECLRRYMIGTTTMENIFFFFLWHSQCNCVWNKLSKPAMCCC